MARRRRISIPNYPADRRDSMAGRARQETRRIEDPWSLQTIHRLQSDKQTPQKRKPARIRSRRSARIFPILDQNFEFSSRHSKETGSIVFAAIGILARQYQGPLGLTFGYARSTMVCTRLESERPMYIPPRRSPGGIKGLAVIGCGLALICPGSGHAADYAPAWSALCAMGTRIADGCAAVRARTIVDATRYPWERDRPHQCRGHQVALALHRRIGW